MTKIEKNAIGFMVGDAVIEVTMTDGWTYEELFENLSIFSEITFEEITDDFSGRTMYSAYGLNFGEEIQTGENGFHQYIFRIGNKVICEISQEAFWDMNKENPYFYGWYSRHNDFRNPVA